MSMLDGILGQINSNLDIRNLAAKVGLTPEQVEGALLALGKAHPAPGSTVDTAAAETGLPKSILDQIVAHIGGEAALGQVAGMLGGAGGGDLMGRLGGILGGKGGAGGGLAGLAGGLFGKK
ncbi:hypothetical protein [uncultured Sphingomonas sp.]|uniref:hypothetical protein n=1 Tax=uncultured Sphingomonas sp. TaxID=158754 RepID=UPI0035CA043F